MFDVSFSASVETGFVYKHPDQDDFYIHCLKMEKEALEFCHSNEIQYYQNPVHCFDICIDFAWGEFDEIIPLVVFYYKNEGEKPIHEYMAELKNISFGNCPEIRDFEISYYDIINVTGDYINHPIDGVPEDVDEDYVKGEIQECFNYALNWVNKVTTSINPEYTLWLY